MSNIFKELMPHGHCFLTEAWAIPFYVFGNIIIGLSYLAIALSLCLVAIKHNHKHFRFFSTVYGSFILACGVGHFIMVWNIYNGMYVFESLWHGATAIISVTSAFVTVLLIRPLLSMSSNNFDNLLKGLENERS